MVKRFCDCCGKEIKKYEYGKIFKWYCHLTDIVHGKMAGHVSMEDGKCISTSGREDAAELCNDCYNHIVILSVKKYFEMKEKNNVKL